MQNPAEQMSPGVQWSVVRTGFLETVQMFLIFKATAVTEVN